MRKPAGAFHTLARRFPTDPPHADGRVPFQLNSSMYYTYVLLSWKDGDWSTGTASDLKARLKEHEKGEVPSTRFRRPLQLIYYEACLDAADAYRREKYLKTGRGKRYLRQRLKTWQTRLSQEKLERHEPLAKGVRLFNARKFFEAHEALEALWLKARGEEKVFLHGLVQVAAAFHHFARHNSAGFRSLLEKALGKLEGFGETKAVPACAGRVKLAVLQSQLREWRDYLERVQNPLPETSPPLPRIDFL